MLDGEVNDEELDKNDNENVPDSNEIHILVKWGGHYKMLQRVKDFKKCNMPPKGIIQLPSSLCTEIDSNNN